MTLTTQITWLLLLAIPIACVAWTVTHEEVFREPREYCLRRSKEDRALLVRKFFYLFTCEYCFSHYVTIIFLFLTGYHLLMADWRGYLVAGFALVYVANAYMSLFGLIRQDIVKEKAEIKCLNKEAKEQKPERHV
ncbi:hypothetical protein IDJ76_07885 [Mucilaginibacter sp. ZB1P21]|uniref:DUF1360 domain-containing protein n=2 Tax=Mucilaginibacter glaciei TaxID=2772109 RepID=A0A926NWC0_9SPHI|nr:hypothetical protein [Mucilaginibacter glaciei]